MVVDLKHMCHNLAKKKCHYGILEDDQSFSHLMASDKLIPAQYGRVVIMRLDALLEMASNLEGPSLKAVHQEEYKARTLEQPQ
jgi:hypothetical protein